MAKNNGRRILGKNITVNPITVDGRIIEYDSNNIQYFDEWNSEDSDFIERISINSTITDVFISASESDRIEAHLYGSVNIDGEIYFDFYKANKEIRIILQFLGECFQCSLRLEIALPRKKDFAVISVKSSAGDINYSEGFSVSTLKVKTLSGRILLYSSASSIIANTLSGDLKLHVDATNNTSVDIHTMSGNVLSYFKNIESFQISANSLAGNVRESPKCSYDYPSYLADVRISSMTGNIEIE